MGCEVLINWVPAKFNCTFLRAAFRIRSNYLDLAAHLGRNPFKAEQLLFARQFIESNRYAIITAGVASGLLEAEAAHQVLVLRDPVSGRLSRKR